MKEYNKENLFKFDIDFLYGKFPEQRYGQAFINTFETLPSGEDIFYEVDNKKAREIAWKGLEKEINERKKNKIDN